MTSETTVVKLVRGVDRQERVRLVAKHFGVKLGTLGREVREYVGDALDIFSSSTLLQLSLIENSRWQMGEARVRTFCRL